ncbi:hypothetical protein M0804_009488 [Polistes exclamans]|nr:hypothetical protein M0804_009488 [Polistes exclamans]
MWLISSKGYCWWWLVVVVVVVGGSIAPTGVRIADTYTSGGWLVGWLVGWLLVDSPPTRLYAAAAGAAAAAYC